MVQSKIRTVLRVTVVYGPTPPSTWLDTAQWRSVLAIVDATGALFDPRKDIVSVRGTGSGPRSLTSLVT